MFQQCTIIDTPGPKDADASKDSTSCSLAEAIYVSVFSKFFEIGWLELGT